MRIGFTFFSVLSELITKRVTNVKSHYFVSLRVWKNKKAWLLSAIIPGILIVLGSLAYFLCSNMSTVEYLHMVNYWEMEIL